VGASPAKPTVLFQKQSSRLYFSPPFQPSQASFADSDGRDNLFFSESKTFFSFFNCLFSRKFAQGGPLPFSNKDFPYACFPKANVSMSSDVRDGEPSHSYNIFPLFLFLPDPFFDRE